MTLHSVQAGSILGDLAETSTRQSLGGCSSISDTNISHRVRKKIGTCQMRMFPVQEEEIKVLRQTPYLPFLRRSQP